MERDPRSAWTYNTPIQNLAPLLRIVRDRKYFHTQRVPNIPGNPHEAPLEHLYLSRLGIKFPIPYTCKECMPEDREIRCFTAEYLQGCLPFKTLPRTVVINITNVRPHVKAILIITPCVLFNLGDCGLGLLNPSFNIVVVLFISLGTMLFDKMFRTQLNPFLTKVLSLIPISYKHLGNPMIRDKLL